MRVVNACASLFTAYIFSYAVESLLLVQGYINSVTI